MTFHIRNTASGGIYSRGESKLLLGTSWGERLVSLSEFENNGCYEVATVCQAVAFNHFTGYSKVRLFGQREWRDWESGCLVGSSGWEQRLEAQGRAKVFVVSIARRLVEAILDCTVEEANIRNFDIPTRDVRAVRYLLGALREDAVTGKPGGAAFAESVAIALLLASSARPGIQRPYTALPVSAVSRVPDFINAHLSDDLGLLQIAEAAEVNIRHLTGAFRRTFGQSVHQYVMRQRLIRAMALLRLGLGLSEIAPMTGFDSSSSVARSLRRVFNYTVSDVRKSAP